MLGILIGVLVATTLIVVAYVRYRETVLTVAVTIVAFCLALVLSTVVTAALRRVRLGIALKVQIMVNITLGVIGVLGIYFLSHPLATPRGVDLEQILNLGDAATLSSVVNQFGATGVFYVAYQIIGLLLLVTSMLLIMLYSIKIHAATSIEAKKVTSPSKAPPRFASWLLLVGFTPNRCFAGAVVLTVVSFGLVTGLGYTLVDSLQNIGAPAPS